VAVQRMDRALAEYAIAGVQTTIPFCRFVMQHEGFRKGQMSTHFVDQEFTPAALTPTDAALRRAVAAAAVLAHTQQQQTAEPLTPVNGKELTQLTNWKARRRAYR